MPWGAKTVKQPVWQRRGRLWEAEVGGVASVEAVEAAGTVADDRVAEEDGAAAAPRFPVSIKTGE